MKHVCVLIVLVVTLSGSCLQAVAAPADDINDDRFALKFKGEDTPKSTCQYYKAIGAVKNCGPNGELEPNFNFDEWKRRNGFAVNPDVDGNGTAFDFIDQLINWLFHGEVSALYLNAVDLNLGRAMHGRMDKDKVAYYVCNYPTIEDARFNKDLQACVAMDYSVVAKDVNDGKPFTKFYVFDNRGKLTPSAKLDRQEPKFVPGLCVACHGGDQYPQVMNSTKRGVGFPEDGTGPPDLGAHFLPFDLDNFEYLNHPRFTRKAQEPQFRHLNQFIFGTNVTPVVEQLLHGWYPRRHSTQRSNFVPPGWDLAQDPAIQDPSLQFSPKELYLKVVKPSCRTCHSVMSPSLNWNRYEGLASNDPATLPDDTQGGFRNNASTIYLAVCGSGQDPKNQSAYMPNAQITLDRFWLSQAPHQPDILKTFLRGVLDPMFFPTITCPEPAP